MVLPAILKLHRMKGLVCICLKTGTLSRGLRGKLLQLRCLLVSDTVLEVSGNALGFSDDEGSVIRGEDLVGGCGKEIKPSCEVIGIERELKVSHHGIAFVAARGEQDCRPEVLEDSEVMRPVAHDGVEDGADVMVATNLSVEDVYEVADLCFRDLSCHKEQFNWSYSCAHPGE